MAVRLPTAGTQMAPDNYYCNLLAMMAECFPEIMFCSRGYWNDYGWLLLQARNALYSVVLNSRFEIVATPTLKVPLLKI